MTSSFSDKGWAAVLDRPAEISRSEIIILKMKVSTDDENDPEYDQITVNRKIRALNDNGWHQSIFQWYISKNRSVLDDDP